MDDMHLVHDARDRPGRIEKDRALADEAAPETTATTVLSLNYHEVTTDPRVFKQARALVERGHRVVVLCRWLKDYPRTETAEGVEIVRFDCFAHETASDLDLNFFPFLDRSRPLIEERYAPYVKEARKLSALSYACDWADERVAATQTMFADRSSSPLTVRSPEGFTDLQATKESFSRAASLLNARIGELRKAVAELDERIAEGQGAATGSLDIERKAARARLTDWVSARELMKRKRIEVQEILARIETEAPDVHAAMIEEAKERQAAEYEKRSARSARTWIFQDRNAQRRAVKQSFAALYQAQAIPFAVNLMREALPCRPAIIHAHDFYTLPAAICLAERVGARVLYDAHEYEPGRATKMPPEGRVLVDRMEMDCLRKVDRMTTVSPSIAELYEERFPGNGPDLILNAPEFDLATFNATNRPGPRSWLKFLARPARTGKLRSLAGLDSSVPLIVFTGGTQRENRGMDKVCQALRHLPKYHLVAMGPRVPNDDIWLIDHAEKAGVRDRVQLLEPVPSDEIVETISDADLAICPIQDAGISYRFALPNKLFEAAFARLPVVVSDLPEMRRFVEELGIGKTMDQTDPERMATVIRDVMAERERYILSLERAEHLVASYSWQAQKERLAGIIQEMIPRAPP